MEPYRRLHPEEATANENQGIEDVSETLLPDVIADLDIRLKLQEVPA